MELKLIVHLTLSVDSRLAAPQCEAQTGVTNLDGIPLVPYCEWKKANEQLYLCMLFVGLRLTIPIYIDRNGNQEDFARNIKSGGTFSSMYFRAQGEIESLGR